MRPRAIGDAVVTAERYPLATIAAYGPTNLLATKLVVSVQQDRRQGASAFRVWTTTGVDVRHDTDIAAAVREFLAPHRIREVVQPDRIIGCPHQEGIDYPLGRVCPQCPFWVDIDRYTLEPIVTPVPTMTPAQILSVLSSDVTEIPREALSSADPHRAALIGPLLAVLDRVTANPDDVSDHDAGLFPFALYLLAKWREPRAYTGVAAWLSLPERLSEEIGGDILTEDGPVILASVYDGDLAPIRKLILNRDADEYGRGAGVDALALLAAWAEVPRQIVIDHFVWLAHEGLERVPGMVWNSLLLASAVIRATPMLGELQQAFEDGLIDPQYATLDELEGMDNSDNPPIVETLTERQMPIDDVAAAISWWGTWAAFANVGRNDLCPCGSGKKYKKCHGR
jgi:hypothetical protein